MERIPVIPSIVKKAILDQVFPQDMVTVTFLDQVNYFLIV